MRKGSIVARAEQARSASQELGAKGGSSAFSRFREMEERIEGREAEGAALAEVEAALRDGPSDRDLEAKFRDLERGGGGGRGDGKTDVEDELAALKKRIRV